MMNKEDAERIVAQYIRVHLDIVFSGTTSFFGRGNPRLSISEIGEGCACSMLTDEADWNAATWDIQPELLGNLAITILFISERAPNGYIFEALWAGDNPVKNLEISLNELLDLVQKNKIGTKERYIVRAA